MRVPNFKTEEGAILYSNTVGKQIAPRVADLLCEAIEKETANGTVTDVLDLGCGPGTVSLRLAADHPEWNVIGVDSSHGMIGQCTARAQEKGLRNVHFVHMDAAQRLDKPFDLAVCNLAFPFFNKPRESMLALHDALRPDGVTLLTVPGRTTWSEFFSVAEDIMGNMVSMARPFLMKFTQAEALSGALRGADFADITETGLEIPFTFSAGAEVLAFFGELFHLLEYSPPALREELAATIDSRFPDGFTMHYEARMVRARRPRAEAKFD